MSQTPTLTPETVAALTPLEMRLRVEETPVVIRRPTLDETLAFLDKRAAIEHGDRPSLDHTDDGDAEILACVTSPDVATVEALLEDYPASSGMLREFYKMLAGAGVAASLVKTTAPETLPDHKRLLALKVTTPAHGEIVLCFKRLGRFEVKVLELETAKAGRRYILASQLAPLVKSHAVCADEDARKLAREVLDAHPLLVAAIGKRLIEAAQARIEVERGKS